MYEGEETLLPFSVASDGRLLVSGPRVPDLWLVEEGALAGVAGIEEVGPPQMSLEGSENFAMLSPDERWLTYTSTATGRYEVYALAYPFEESPRPIHISPGGGEEGVWSPRGDGLYYRDARRWYWVPLTGSSEDPFGEPELFVEGPYLNLPGIEYAVSPDGSRLLVVRSVAEPTTTTLNVITNWFQVLEAAVGN